VISIIGFKTWVRTAPRRSSFVYHVGDLAYDRQNERNPDRKALDSLAKVAWQMAKLGDITLLQRKMGKDLYQYRAVKR